MAKDPYRYFRIEARELVDGLVRGVLEMEKGASGREPVARLLRLAHTLKGAARVVKQPSIAELAHALEGQLEPHREGQPIARPGIDALLRLLDGVAAALQQLEVENPAQAASAPHAGAAASLPGQSPAPERAGGPTETARNAANPLQERPAAIEAAPQKAAHQLPERLEPLQTVRVELGEMDALLQGVSEAGVQLSSLRARVARLGEKTQQSLGTAVEHVERELLQVRDAADRLRLLPIGTLFGPLDRAVRDAARSLDRDVSLRTVADESRLEAQVLSKLGEALLHIVRNAVAHGIEPADERRARHKSAAGEIEIAASRRGGHLRVTCRDDGRGIDVAAVRAAAVSRGLVPPDDARALDLDSAVELLLRGGLSTTQVADATSGRGVGLDVVRTVMSELRGKVAVRSRPGAGTEVELSVPLSLSSVTALQVEAGGLAVSIPLSSVPRVLRIPGLAPGAVARSELRASIEHEGASVPLLPLWQALRRAAPGRGALVVLVRHEQQLTAVQVDRLLGSADVVVRPLPAMQSDPLVSGASLDADGNPCLLLSPAGLTAAARADWPANAAPAQPARQPILVIDDSLTTRMLEQSILESAGYEVELATSAEEGLEKARVRRYGLFLVDVEMPGIDGFEFVARTRADPMLRETPAMLVTSRGSPEDKRRGAEAGAHAYFLKGEFDQSRLLQSIRELLG